MMLLRFCGVLCCDRVWVMLSRGCVLSRLCRLWCRVWKLILDEVIRLLMFFRLIVVVLLYLMLLLIWVLCGLCSFYCDYECRWLVVSCRLWLMLCCVGNLLCSVSVLDCVCFSSWLR